MKPKYLTKWTLPSCYMGKSWDDYYSFLGQSRDSDALERSNFIKGLEAIGGESKTVIVVHETHWAVGWVEWIAIHQSNVEALKIADKLKGELQDYPVIDENHWSELEQEDASLTWKNCFNNKERLEYIREHRGSFEFRSFSDLLECVRGNYFAGDVSNLLY